MKTDEIMLGLPTTKTENKGLNMQKLAKQKKKILHKGERRKQCQIVITSKSIYYL